jgi:hypothetical protein
MGGTGDYKKRTLSNKNDDSALLNGSKWLDQT